MISPPLKPQWFQILLALSGDSRHGYGIQRAVLEQTGGHMRLWPAMLYRSLNKLSESGLIHQIDSPAKEPEDERRQYYALTQEGRVRLRDEADVLARWVATARGLEI